MKLRLEQFRFFQNEGPVQRSRRDLPHWHQEGVCAFVTMRLCDALPAEVLAGWAKERTAWLRGHGIDPTHSRWREELEALEEETVREFHRTFTARLHELLDAGHGACWFRRSGVRTIMEAALRHGLADRYLSAGWVIMPNHVHVLLQPAVGHHLLDLCESWKRFTAREINRCLSRRGHFWQGEGWDHLVRRAEFLRKYRRYIRLNPLKAGLKDGEYSLWMPEIVGLEE